MNYSEILSVFLVLSLIFGAFLVAAGLLLRKHFAFIVQPFTAQLVDVQKLSTLASINEADQNICPLLESSTSSLHLGHQIDTIILQLVLLGALMVIYSLLGTTGIFFQHRKTQILSLIMTSVCIVIEINAIYLLFVGNDNFYEGIKSELIDRLYEDYNVEGAEDSLFTQACNTLMLYFECCGVESVKDFGNLTFVEKLPGNDHLFSFRVAPACCEKTMWGMAEDFSYFALRECAVQGPARLELIYNTGCFNTILESLRTNSTIIFFTVSSCIKNLVLLCIMINVIFGTDPEVSTNVSCVPCPLRRVAGIAAPEVPSEEEPLTEIFSKKERHFIPYAKLSSFHGADLKRAKSTEIW